VALSAEHVHGLAVHAAARIVDEAGPGEVLVSGTTRDVAEALPDWYSNRGVGTASRACSGSTTSLPQHRPRASDSELRSHSRQRSTEPLWSPAGATGGSPWQVEVSRKRLR
jgi:class 3 adenylate cyclase